MPLKGLEAETRYCAMLFAFNEDGTAHGELLDFETAPPWTLETFPEELPTPLNEGHRYEREDAGEWGSVSGQLRVEESREREQREREAREASERAHVPTPTAIQVPRASFALIGSPIVAETRGRHGRMTYELVMRVDKALPRTRAGRIEASLRAGEITGPIASYGSHERGHCYASRAIGLARRSARPGRAYAVKLSIGSPLQEQIETTAATRRYASRAAMLAGVRRQLGC